MVIKRLLNAIKPSITINAIKIITGKKRVPERLIRTAYALEYGTDAMEYVRDDFDD